MTDKSCNTKLTPGDLQTILEVNRKSVEIYLETVQQNEEIMEHLLSIKTKTEEIDRLLFRLQVVLGSLGIGTIVAIIQAFLSHR